jgi:hypothetical protein
MKKIAVLVTLGVLGPVGVAQADPGSHGHPAGPHPKPCTPRAEGYNGTGTLVTASLSPATGRHRASGTIELNVTRANHRATLGDQTFTLTAARVIAHHGVDATAPAAGSRVGVHGTITALPKGCSATGFTPTVTIHKVDVREAKAVKP